MPWWQLGAFRWDVLVVLTSVGALYGLGWWRLRRDGHPELASGARLASYVAGLATIAVGLMGPIDVIQQYLLAAHMVQHLLLMLVAAPLLVVAAPFPIAVWGLPPRGRELVGRLLAPGTRSRRAITLLAGPWFVLTVHLVTLWLWHVPEAYDAALRNRAVHDAEHLTFFLTALAFWWASAAAEPHLHPRLGYGLRIVLVLMALFQTQILSIAIAMPDRPLYGWYETVARPWDVSVMDDQMWGGAIMWVPGGIWYVLAAVVLLERMMSRQEKLVRRAGPTSPPSLPETVLPPPTG